jgi:hypothetical protein
MGGADGITRPLARRSCPAYRLVAALPPPAHLLLRRAQVVGRRCERQGALDLH